MNACVRRFLALALLFFLCQTALLVHAAIHIDKNSVQCQLCVCQAQQNHGLPVPTFYIKVNLGYSPLPHTVLPAFADRDQTRPYFQRAPPVIA